MSKVNLTGSLSNVHQMLNDSFLIAMTFQVFRQGDLQVSISADNPIVSILALHARTPW